MTAHHELYSIEPTPHSYLGAYSKVDIPAHTSVLKDKPLFTLDAPFQAYLFEKFKNGNGVGPTPVEGEEEEEDDEIGKVENLEDWFEKEIQRCLKLKTKEEESHFYTLSNMHPSQPRAYAIFLTNAVSLSQTELGGLFPILSRFNSCCRPNLSRPDWNSKSKEMELKSVRRIERGEELNWDYLAISFTFESPLTRRDELKKVFGFDCACRACLQWFPRADDEVQSNIGNENRAEGGIGSGKSARLIESEKRLRELRRLKECIDLGGEVVLRRMQKLAWEEELWEMSDRLGEQADRKASGQVEEEQRWDERRSDEQDRGFH